MLLEVVFKYLELDSDLSDFGSLVVSHDTSEAPKHKILLFNSSIKHVSRCKTILWGLRECKKKGKLHYVWVNYAICESTPAPLHSLNISTEDCFITAFCLGLFDSPRSLIVSSS